jgi:uncharacterized membrane protein
VPVLSRLRTKLAELAASMDAFATSVAHTVPNALLWPLLYASCIGSGVFVMRHLSWVPVLDTNKVPKDDSYKMVTWVAVTLAALGLCSAIVSGVARWVIRRRGRVPPTRGSVVAELHRRMRPLLMLPLLTALTLNAIERDSPKETHFLIVLAGAIATASAYAWLRPLPRLRATLFAEGDAPTRARRALDVLSQIAAAVAVAALWGAYGWFFSRFSITNHHALRTSTIDLGLYDNIFYQSAHGHPLGCSFIKQGYHGSAHFDPILVLLSPLYRLYPRAEFLLVLQSVWLGAGAVPVYLIAREKLGSRLSGVAFAAMYVMYPAVHGANMYDFHSLTLVTPIALFLLYFLETGRLKSYAALLLPTLLVREDIAILLCFVGAYAIFTRRPALVRVGWITIFASVTYFVVVKRFFMTSIDPLNGGPNSYGFAYYYEDLIPNKNGEGGLLVSIFSNPVFVLKTVFAEAKILYLFALFSPLAFLPLCARPQRVMLVWGLFFCLLASRAAVFSTHFQYSCIIIPVAFASAPGALLQIEDGPFVARSGLEGLRFRRSLVAGAFVASVLCSWKFGGILDNASFHGGFTPPARTLTDKEKETYQWVRTEIAKIPLEDSVGLSNRTGAHASNRPRAYHYNEHPEADWAFIDENEVHGGELDRQKKALQRGELELVSRHDHFAIYHRTKKP